MNAPRWSLAALCAGVILFGSAPEGAARPQAAPPGTPPAAAPPPASSQARPVFKVTADTVEVDVLVVDKRGAFVRGLGKDDFVVLEDGVPQSPSTFELVDIPRPAGKKEAGAVASVPEAMPEPAGAAPRSRLYFLVFDDYHIAPEHSARARKLASDFVAKYLGPADRAAVLFTSARRGASQDLTSDRALLNAAIARLVGHKVMSAAVANYGGDPAPRPRPGVGDSMDPMRFDQAKAAMDTLSAIGTFAASIHGERKALVYISSGPDFDFGAAYGGGDPSRSADDHSAGNDLGVLPAGVQLETPRALRDAFRAFANQANRANVSLYAIDPRGPTQGGEYAVMVRGTETAGTISGSPSSLSLLQMEVQKSHDSLRAMSAVTGGEAFVGTGDFDRAFRLIVDASSTYYLMSYVSPAPADGKYHRIEVRTNRPGVTVRARPGFVKPARRP